MTDFRSENVQSTGRFEEHLEILGKELEMAVKGQRPCIILVVCSSLYAREDAQAELQNFLIDLHQEISHIRIKDQEMVNDSCFPKELGDPEHTIYFVEDFYEEGSQQSKLYAMLNSQRDVLVERRVRVVFWLTQDEVVNFAHFAPDFWAQHHCLIELTEGLRSDKVLQETINSVWCGIGDPTEEMKGSDEKVPLDKSLLDDLPQGSETPSTRVNLLLNLGLLYWRKDDYEEADRLLREALKCAGKMQDRRFEAECFNAIALVKTSRVSLNEAIDAYKQAIHLAPERYLFWNNVGNLCLKIFRNDEAMIAFQKAIAHDPKDAIGWNGLGNVYFKMGYMDDAIISYRKAISFMPAFAQPWNGLGDIFSATGRLDDAIRAYRKAIELNMHYVTPWLRLGIVFTRQERYREAIKAYQAALSLDPKNCAIWTELGTLYLKSGSYEEAAEIFSKAIHLNSEDGWAYRNLALTYTHQEKFSEAVTLYLKSIDLFLEEKDKAVSWNQLANVYRLLNDYDNALAAYQIADTLDPRIRASRNKNTPDQSMPMAVPDKQVSNPDAAKSETANTPSDPQVTVKNDSSIDQKSGSSAPEPGQQPLEVPGLVFNSANGSESKNPSPKVEGAPNITHEQAKPVLIEPEQLEAKGDKMPNLIFTKETHSENRAGTQNQSLGSNGLDEIKTVNADGWNATGNAYFKRGEMAKAIQAYNKAIQLDPSFGWPYSNLALTYLTQGQYAEAILLYEKSLETLKSDKDRAVSWNGLGNIYRRINDYENAVAAYQKAAELDPVTAGMRDGTNALEADQSTNNSQTWNDLGEAFFKAGTYDKAVNAFYKAIEMEPDNGWPYANLARILVSQGQFKKAIAVYQKSIDVLKNDKDKAAVWNLLGNAYRKMNDYDNAVKAYQKAVILADEGVNLLTRTRFSLLSNCNIDQ